MLRAQMTEEARVLALIWLVACTGEKPEDSADTGTDTAPVDDSGGTTTPDPVWTQDYRISTSATLQGVYASGTEIYVVGTGGTSWAVTPGTDPFAVDLEPPVEGNDLTDLWGQGAGATTELVATGHAGYIARFGNGAWSVTDEGTSNHEGIGGTANSLYAVSWGGIYHWEGAGWNFEEPPGDSRLNDVWATADTAFAVGESGVILTRLSDGTWSEVESGTEADLNAIGGSSATDLWVAGADGTVLHFDGVSFTPQEVGTTAALWSVFAPEEDAVYVVGNNGVALLWNGTEWASLPTGVDNNLYGLHGVNAQDVWAVGNRGMILNYVEGAR
jgi:hypothetical protein